MTDKPQLRSPRRKPASANAAAGAGPPVEVRTSARRHKTATAYWEDGRIVVVVPTRTSAAARDELVRTLVSRVLNRRGRVPASDPELFQRAVELGRRYLDGVRPTSVRWSRNQRHRWGSCSMDTGAIRVSERLRLAPPWVLDSVLVHELAHLVEAGHGPAFTRLVSRYPRQREADAFLDGFALGLGSGSWLNGNGDERAAWARHGCGSASQGRPASRAARRDRAS